MELSNVSKKLSNVGRNPHALGLVQVVFQVSGKPKYLTKEQVPCPISKSSN